jgi:hypothetical protein
MTPTMVQDCNWKETAQNTFYRLFYIPENAKNELVNGIGHIHPTVRGFLGVL